MKDPENVTADEIVQAGEKMLILYDGTARSLDELRFKMYCTKVATGTVYLFIISIIV